MASIVRVIYFDDLGVRTGVFGAEDLFKVVGFAFDVVTSEELELEKHQLIFLINSESVK